MTKSFAAMVALWLTGCASVLQSPAERAGSLALSAGFSPVKNTVLVRGYQRLAAHGSDLTIYIEGDGARWKRPNMPPVDPTPPNPMALKLAIADAYRHPTSSVAYLGRPCQYLEGEVLARCDPTLWRNSRFGSTAIGQMNQVVDHLVKSHGATSIALVGYSGGGSMAALLAAKRRDVSCLVTIAAPLDINAWTTAKGVSSLDGSLNPRDFAPTLSAVPQWHIMGGSDQTVPPVTSKAYLDTIAPTSFEVIPGYDHDTDWEADWSELLEHTCLAQRK